MQLRKYAFLVACLFFAGTSFQMYAEPKDWLTPKVVVAGAYAGALVLGHYAFFKPWTMEQLSDSCSEKTVLKDFDRMDKQKKRSFLKYGLDPEKKEKVGEMCQKFSQLASESEKEVEQNDDDDNKFFDSCNDDEKEFLTFEQKFIVSQKKIFNTDINISNWKSNATIADAGFLGGIVITNDLEKDKFNYSKKYTYGTMAMQFVIKFKNDNNSLIQECRAWSEDTYTQPWLKTVFCVYGMAGLGVGLFCALSK